MLPSGDAITTDPGLATPLLPANLLLSATAADWECVLSRPGQSLRLVGEISLARALADDPTCGLRVYAAGPVGAATLFAGCLVGEGLDPWHYTWLRTSYEQLLEVYAALVQFLQPAPLRLRVSAPEFAAA